MTNTPSRLRNRARVAGAVALATTLAIGTCGIAPAEPRQPLPVPYTFLSGAVAELTRPGAPLPGADDWGCVVGAEHPRPVVLVHGTLGGGADNWATYGPLLHNEGYCVFTLTYGAVDDAGWPLSAVGGVRSIEQVAVPQVAEFVDRVLEATGAEQVDLVGHSQGTLVAGAVAKWARPGRVHSVVSLAALWQGTGGSTVQTLLDANPAARAALAGHPLASAESMLPGSAFLRRLWEGGSPYAPGVQYTNISTRYDEAVWPYTSGLVPGAAVVNHTVQDGCEIDVAEHAALASDPRAADYVLQALDPGTPRTIRCVPVAPVHGAVGEVPPAR